jgi:hypothetical protein
MALQPESCKATDVTLIQMLSFISSQMIFSRHRIWTEKPELINTSSDCLKRDKWEAVLRPIPNKTILPVIAQGPEFSLGSRPGLWCATNPLIWSILDPVLRLVSRFLEDIHTNEFVSFVIEERKDLVDK